MRNAPTEGLPEHDCIGTVENCVSAVGGLGALGRRFLIMESMTCVATMTRSLAAIRASSIARFCTQRHGLKETFRHPDRRGQP